MGDTTARAKLIKRVNRKAWWRTCLPSKKAIRDRGLFFASSFEEAEFYGRPLDTPFRVQIKNPLVGSFAHVQKKLLGHYEPRIHTIKQIFARDRLIRKHAGILGFDSIIVLSEKGYRNFCADGTLPRSIELNVF